MTGGLIQLVAYGLQDIFLTRDPQITFFKVVYRRHTNFSIEPIRQYFVHTPDFGKKTTCILSANGDLLGKTFLVITLPQIKQFSNGDSIDTLTKFAWVRKIAYALIKTIDIEIGGQLIDRHYGEWMNIWAELTEKTKTYAWKKMTGDVTDLTDFTNGKDEYTIYIPLSFWFCRASGLALPLVSMEYSQVRVNLELNDLDKCSLTTPTNYIEIENDIVNFQQFEYIEQNVNGVIASGIFTSFDNTTKRLYYSRISRDKFQSMPLINENGYTPQERRALVYSDTNSKYWIRGLTSNVFAMPKFNTMPQSHTFNNLRNIAIKDCYLIVNYIFVDDDERKQFVQSRHDYIIEQLQIINEKTIESSNRTMRLDLIQPSKLLAWVVQSSYFQDKNNNDWFNYTNSYKYDSSDNLVGKTLVKNETLELNGQERLSFRVYNYFNYAQAHQYFPQTPNEGVNIYSFGMFPLNPFPSGTCNMSQMDNIELRLNLNQNITITNDAKFRGYSLGYNIYRIVNGLGGLVFSQ